MDRRASTTIKVFIESVHLCQRCGEYYGLWEEEDTQGCEQRVFITVNNRNEAAAHLSINNAEPPAN